MTPIAGLSEQKRLPRLGKIRLGIKKISPRTNREYPVATDYFVCPPEVQKVYGEKPKRLDVIVPVEDEEIWANQYYRQYSRSRGLVCKGDGVTCRRMVDIETGDVATRDTKEITWREGCECLGRECPDYKGKACQEVMNLQVLLPKVPGLGVWQIDTGSVNSIMNINNCATMIRAMCGRVSWIPLTLTLEPTEVNNPDDGKKKTVHCMQLRYERSAESLLTDSEKPRLQMLLAGPVDDEAPEDRQLSTHNKEKAEELIGKAGDDIAELWPESEEDHSWLNKKNIARESPKPHDASQVEQGRVVTPQAVATPTESDRDFEKMGKERDQIVAGPKAKGKSAEKVPDFKMAAELWNYALKHGYSIEGIKKKTGFAYPLEVVDLKETIKQLYPDN